jgi:hypothetical protein
MLLCVCVCVCVSVSVGWRVRQCVRARANGGVGENSCIKTSCFLFFLRSFAPGPFLFKRYARL